MAITYQQSADLMKDPIFVGRVKVAVLKFATSITDEATTTPAHSARLRWAQQAILNADQMAFTVTPPTVLDPAVQQDGAAITDAALQSAVENTVNKMF